MNHNRKYKRTQSSIRTLFPFSLLLLVGGCVNAPPSLFEVREMCEEGKVQRYKTRTKDQSVDFECKS